MGGLGGNFDRKSCQHGPKLGPQMEPTWVKHRFKNQAKFRCVLGSTFEAMLVDLGRKNGRKLASTSIKNRRRLRKVDFCKIVLWLQRGLDFFKFEGSKLGAKIEQKNIKIRHPRCSASGHRFFIDFEGFGEASWEGKSSQVRTKIDSKRHPKRQSKKHASWKGLHEILVSWSRATGCGGTKAAGVSSLALGKYHITRAC